MQPDGLWRVRSRASKTWHALVLALLLLVIAARLWSDPLFSQASITQQTDSNVSTAQSEIDQQRNLAAERDTRQKASETVIGSAFAAQNEKLKANDQPSTIDAAASLACGGLAQEAENATLSGLFVVGNDTAASGGKYIHTPNGSGNFYNGPVSSNKAEFCFTVPITGTYYIRASVFAADTLNDSFYVQVDGTPELGYLWDIFPTSSYIIDYVNDRFFADPAELELTPGEHKVVFYPREDGARLDTVELQFTTPNAGPVPVCGGLIQEAEDGAMQGSFVIEDSPIASGGKYIVSPEGTGSYWYGPNTLQSAKYCFNVKDTGIYKINARVYGPYLLSDSFYVRVDDPKSTAFLWDTNAANGFATDSANHRFVEDPVLLKLPTGLHTVTVYVREDGTQLDELQLVFTGIYTEPEEPPITARPISGTIRPDSSGLTEEVDFSEIYVRLIDAATLGKTYSKRVQVDRIGHYRFEGMPPGKYIVVLELPAIYISNANRIEVNATVESSVSISFDIRLKLEQIYLPLIGR